MPFQPLVEQYNKFVETYYLPEQEKIKLGIKTHEAQARFIGISIPTFYKWKKQVEAEKGKPNEYDFKLFLDHIKTRAYAGNAKTKEQELYARLMGWFDTKKEINIELTADIIAKAIFGCKEELQSFGYPVMEGEGVVKVPSKPDLLSGEIRESQGHNGGDSLVHSEGIQEASSEGLVDPPPSNHSESTSDRSDLVDSGICSTPS